MDTDSTRQCNLRAIEETITSLTTRLSLLVSKFGGCLVVHGFMNLETMNGMLDIQGEEPQRKVQRFLATVVAAIKDAGTPEASEERFKSFVSIIKEEMGLIDLGQQLLDKSAALKERPAKPPQQKPVNATHSPSISAKPGSTSTQSVSKAIVKSDYFTTETAEKKCKELQDTFILLVEQTNQHLNNSHQSVLSFQREFLLKISSPKSSETMRFFQERSDCISKAQSYDSLFLILSTFWNYLNYGLLKCIITVKGNDNLKGKICLYANEADTFQQLTKLHVFWAMEPTLHVLFDETSLNLSEFKTTIMTLSITPESTLKDIEAIRLKVTQECRLPTFALILAKVEQGSVVVTWLVHTSAVSMLCGMTEELKQELHILNIQIANNDEHNRPTENGEAVESKEPSKFVVLDVASSNISSGSEDCHPSLEGGYDCVFVEPPKELQYECIICKNILRDPCHLDCDCDIRFCYACIKTIAEQKKPCPHCNKGFKNITLDRKLERELGQKEVIYNEKKLLLKDLYGIRCDHCHKSFKTQSEVNSHTVECGLRPFSCDFCHVYHSTYNDVTHAHWPVCPSHPMPCPNNCGKQIERQTLASHVDEDCPYTMVDCDYHYAGCMEWLPRKDISEHLKENIAIHASLQAEYFRECIEIKNEEVEQLQLQMGQLQWQIPGKLRKIKEEMRNEMKPSPPWYTRIMKRNDKPPRPIQMSSSNLPEILLIWMISALVIILVWIFPNILSVDKTPNYNQKMMEKLYFADVEEQFDMFDFHMFNETGTPWFSPPFYKNGYRMCLEVATNKRPGTHLSVFVRLMQGEVDDKIEWPFKGNITIQILDPRGENHHSHTIHFTDKIPQSYTGRVLEKEMADLGYGRRTFISHNHLKSNYLKNDSLQFQIKPNYFTDQISMRIEELTNKMNEVMKSYEKVEVLRSKPSLLGERYVMHYFSRYNTAGRSWPWFSAPFYVNSYKMCLQVCTQSPTHIAVGIHLMRGEFDDRLKWPFQGEITVQLLDQTGLDEHYEQTIIVFNEFMGSDIAGRVTHNERTCAMLGLDNFIARSGLEPNYLQNDELHFGIKV